MVKGAIALLDLPVGTAISLDGEIIVLQRADFVGVSEVPSGDFHLVTIQRGGGATPSMILHGFIVFCDEDKDWLFLRKYDPLTEEVSTTVPDDLTTNNLHLQMRNNQIDAQRIVPFPKLITTDQWREATKHISNSILRKRGIQHGDKILPGAYVDMNDVMEDTKYSLAVDGMSITYPAIPCIDPAISIHKTKHQGTKKYLSTLSPTDRSLLFRAPDPAQQALEWVLNKEYSNEWEDLLGDLQLAFVLFIHLQCFASLEHWRDMIAMLSLIRAEGIRKQTQQYAMLLNVLQLQLLAIESDLFDDLEYSEENFLVPALKRLCAECNQTKDTEFERNTVAPFMRLLSQRFESSFALEGGDQSDLDIDLVESEDSDDAPVIVTSEEIEAYTARQLRSPVLQSGQGHPETHKQRYPLLFAAVQPHEDLIMTCARVLDEKVDVSVVREAAAYLEEVEAKK